MNFIKFLCFYFFRNLGFIMKNPFFEKKWKIFQNLKKIHFFLKKSRFLRKNMVVSNKKKLFYHAKAWWAFSIQMHTCKSIVKKLFFYSFTCFTWRFCKIFLINHVKRAFFQEKMRYKKLKKSGKNRKKNIFAWAL